MHLSPMLARYIVVEGNIGSGKTSLATLLAETFKSELLLEEFADNSFLPKFYENPERWAFPLELSFLADRYHQMKKTIDRILISGDLLVADYLFDKSLIFAKNNLTANEIHLYETFFSIVNAQLPKPDLIIYLDNSIENLQKKIKKRNRVFEKNISSDYLEQITKGYKNFIANNPSINWLIVPADNLDFVNKPEDFNKVLSDIKFALSNNQTNLFGSSTID